MSLPRVKNTNHVNALGAESGLAKVRPLDVATKGSVLAQVTIHDLDLKVDRCRFIAKSPKGGLQMPDSRRSTHL